MDDPITIRDLLAELTLRQKVWLLGTIYWRKVENCVRVFRYGLEFFLSLFFRVDRRTDYSGKVKYGNLESIRSKSHWERAIEVAVGVDRGGLIESGYCSQVELDQWYNQGVNSGDPNPSYFAQVLLNRGEGWIKLPQIIPGLYGYENGVCKPMHEFDETPRELVDYEPQKMFDLDGEIIDHHLNKNEPDEWDEWMNGIRKTTSPLITAYFTDDELRYFFSQDYSVSAMARMATDRAITRKKIPPEQNGATYYSSYGSTATYQSVARPIFSKEFVYFGQVNCNTEEQ